MGKLDSTIIRDSKVKPQITEMHWFGTASNDT